MRLGYAWGAIAFLGVQNKRDKWKDNVLKTGCEEIVTKYQAEYKIKYSCGRKNQDHDGFIYMAGT